MAKAIPEKGTMEYGAWNALYHGLKLQPGEKVVVVTDKDQRKIGDTFSEQARGLDGNVYLFVMEDFGGRPLTSLPAEIEDALNGVNVTLYLAGTREGELAFRRPMIKTAVGNGARHGHGVGVNEEIMLTGMQADIPDSNRLCGEIGERLNNILWARVTTEKGTDITLEFRPDIKWLVSDWDFTKKWHNIPSGEVFTWPYRTNGTYIVDGVLGDHFDGKYGSLQKTPVIYRVKDNHIVDIFCNNKDIERELREYVFGTHNGDILGELGVGTLPVDRLVYRMLQDEKALGTVHIAHGSNYPEETGAPDYGQSTHCDGVMLRATLQTNRDFILKNGVYQPRS